jgi:hypothetical protein
MTGRADWVCFSGLSAAFQSDSINYYDRLDLFAPLLNVDPGWKKLSECLPDSSLRKSEWYNDFVLSCGVRDILGSRLVETSSHFALFGLHQQIGRRFDDNTTAVMENVAGSLASVTRQHIGHLFGRTLIDADESIKIRSHITSDRDRYYFHVRNGKQYPDRTDREFSSYQEAAAHAAVIPAELAKDEDWEAFVISITDVHGRIIVQVPVRNEAATCTAVQTPAWRAGNFPTPKQNCAPSEAAPDCAVRAPRWRPA